MEPRLNMITLGVADVERSASFYETVFSTKRSGYSNDGIAFIRLSTIVLALFSRKALAKDANVDASGSGFKGVVLTYNTRSEPEVNVLMDLVEKAGGTTVKKPQRLPWGAYNSYVSDPDGNLIEIVCNPILPMLETGVLDI